MTWRTTTAVCGALVWIVGALAALDAAFPPNLARFEDRSAAVLAGDGTVLRPFLSTDDKWRLHTESKALDPRYVAALKAFEDKRFDSHHGVDPLAIMRAIGQWAGAGRIVSGASTLTMQTARLLEPRSRTIPAKMIEIARAVQLEVHFSKTEILTIYATLAPFGGNIEGLRAASLAYFGKDPEHLTVAQSALLVALPQSPERTRPDRHPENAAAARNKVLARLAAQGAITEQERREAEAEPVPQNRKPMAFLAPRLARSLKSDLASASSGTRPRDNVQTFIVKDIQKNMESLIAAEDLWADDDPAIAAIVVDNHTRQVIAYAGGADFWGIGGQLDMAAASRSPGSTLKPFIYGMGFDDLIIHPETLIDDHAKVFGTYAPKNFAQTFQGTITVRQALRQSLNIPAVSILNEVGPIRFASTLSQMGADLRFASQGIIPSLPLALGGVGISLRDLTALYTALGNGGQYAPLRVTVDDPEAKPKTLLGAAATWYVTDILRGTPMPDGWAHRFGVARDRNIAFKTGTSYGFRDAWAVGYSGTYTVGVFVGRPDGTPRPDHFGLNTAAPVLLKIFALLPGETRPFPAKPDNVVSVFKREQLPVGMRVFTPSGRTRTAVLKDRPRTAPPRIKFPSDGIAVALPVNPQEGLTLKAVGGSGQLRWIVDGKMLPASDFLEPTVWYPATAGFADVTLIDDQGRTDHASIRILPAESVGTRRNY